MKQRRDIRPNWDCRHSRILDPEYLRLRIDLKRQEQGEFSVEEYWDEPMPDTGRAMGEEMVSSAVMAQGMAAAFR